MTSYECIVSVGVASEGSRFTPGTILLVNKAGRMPTHRKEDGSASSVFPINVAIKPSNMEVGDQGLATFELRWNKGMEHWEYQVTSFAKPNSLLDLRRTTKEIKAEEGVVNVPFTPTKEKNAVADPDAEPVTADENPLP